MRKDGYAVSHGDIQEAAVPDNGAKEARQLAEVLGKRLVFFKDNRPKEVGFPFAGLSLRSRPDFLYINVNTSLPATYVAGQNSFTQLGVLTLRHIPPLKSHG